MLADVTKMLLSLGALKHNDSRVQRASETDANAEARSGLRWGKVGHDDEDSDWD